MPCGWIMKWSRRFQLQSKPVTAEPCHLPMLFISQQSVEISSVTLVSRWFDRRFCNDVVLGVVTIRRSSFVVDGMRQGHESGFQSTDAALQPGTVARLQFRRHVLVFPRLLPAAESLHQATRDLPMSLQPQTTATQWWAHWLPRTHTHAHTHTAV